MWEKNVRSLLKSFDFVKIFIDVAVSPHRSLIVCLLCTRNIQLPADSSAPCAVAEWLAQNIKGLLAKSSDKAECSSWEWKYFPFQGKIRNTVLHGTQSSADVTHFWTKIQVEETLAQSWVCSAFVKEEHELYWLTDVGIPSVCCNNH